MSCPENPGQMVAGLHLRLARTELERDEWMNQVVGIRAQQREALKRAEDADARARRARADALREAAEEVHRENRWALEQAMRGEPQDAVDRGLVLEKVLRDRADAIVGCYADKATESL